MQKWIYPGMHQPVPDTTKPPVPIPGGQPTLSCPTCGKIQCSCTKPQGNNKPAM